MVQGITVFLANATASPAVAQAIRYELFPIWMSCPTLLAGRPRRMWWTRKKINCVCSARYNYRDLTANNGSCVKLDPTIGRPSLNETYVAHAVTGSAMVNPFLPVIWFIDPGSGDVQFCAIRHAGLCVKISLP